MERIYKNAASRSEGVKRVEPASRTLHPTRSNNSQPGAQDKQNASTRRLSFRRFIENDLYERQSI